MKELTIQIRVDVKQTAIVIKRNGFEENVSASYEVIGILQNLIRLEQDKMINSGTSVTKTLKE